MLGYMRLPQSRTGLPLVLASLAAVLVLFCAAPVSPAKAAAKGSSGPSVKVVRNTPNSTYYVELGWNPSTSNDVVGYNIYRGHLSGGPYRKINRVLRENTWFNDRWVRDGKIYYYVTTAVNAQGQESAYSNEVQALIPIAY